MPRPTRRKSTKAVHDQPQSDTPQHATSSAARSAAAGGAPVSIRFYCQGIGDCHLLRFARPDGDFWMLIDCGIHSSVRGGTETINAVVDDILSVTRRLDVIVLTHEHWDHNSGFFLAREKFSQFDIGEIWAAWTENPEDPQAREFDKFKGEALAALQGASQRLDKVLGLSPHLASVQNGLQAVLAFNFGAQGEKVRAARNAFVALGKGHVKYLEPKTAPFELAIDSGKRVPNVRVYVLGPPRDAAMLKVIERPSEMYGLGPAGSLLAGGLNSSFNVSDGIWYQWDDATAPFDSVDGFDLPDFINLPLDGPHPKVSPVVSADTAAKSEETAGQTNKTSAQSDETDARARAVEAVTRARAQQSAARARTAKLIHECYTGSPAAQAWRRIDNDWLGVSADLAIQLDKRTNNSSLVLAFEFVETKRVMLFVGDAQVGNWLSWKDVKWTVENTTVSAHDLLARTVLYKVGHHGSHNATLKENGLQLMTSPDLSAFIPTNKDDAKNVGWGEMPFEPLLEDLERRARNRVIRADDAWLKQAHGQPPANIVSGAIKALRHDPQNGRWVELDVG
jgi:beta-lactamase superfamily II metal-dependent hydrolase